MEPLTVFLAQILGVYLLVAGMSGLLYPERMKKAMQEFSKSRIVPYFDGALALIIGLFIVLLHNNWDNLPASLVSLVGWLALLEGFSMFLLPEKNMQDFLKWFKEPSVARATGIFAIVTGAYLTYAGFSAFLV